MKFGKQRLWLGCLVAGLLVSAGCSDDGDEGTETPLPDIQKDVKVIDGDQPPPPIVCTTNADCTDMDGTDACRVGSCDLAIGQCLIFEMPNCCVQDLDCDDLDPQTTDFCDPDDGLCKAKNESLVCGTDADCVTDAPCITFECDEVCVTWKKADCCVDHEDCGDADFCTTDQCLNFKCVFAASTDPLCCGDIIASWDFAGGLPGDYAVEGNGEAVAWHHSTTRSHSSGGSIRFANPDSGDYLNPQSSAGIPASQGTLVSPELVMPTGSSNLSFWLYLDIEPVEEYDLFVLQARTDAGVVDLWSKAALEENQYKAWIQVNVDTSALAGQPVRFAWSVDTIDGTVNTGEGVFIDDVAIVQGCGDSPPCTSDADCEDGDPCTENVCGDEGVCGAKQLEKCCLSSTDCLEPLGPCEKLAGCIENQCVYEGEPGCCQTNDDCDDGNDCTIGFCTDDGGCTYEVDPDCCTPEILYAAAFPFGDDGGVEIENDNPAGGWNISDTNAYSPPRSLHYGDPATGTYDFGGASAGIVRLPPLELPGGESAELTFWLYADVETFPMADELTVRVRQSEGQPVEVWAKADLGDDQFKTWVPITVDLSTFAGSKIRVSFSFDTIDAIDNDGSGIHIDDIAIGVGCGGGGCTSDEQCVDDNDCTMDSCGDNGQCFHVPDPDCAGCGGPLDCDDGNPCTADFCVDEVCQHVPVPSPECTQECEFDEQCADDDPCTQDLCGDEGLCYYLANPDCGICATVEDCDDGDTCTIDFCISGECSHFPSPDPDCNAECMSDAQCQDDDPCTTDFCGAEGICQHVGDPNCGFCDSAADCQDGDACTIDFCVAGTCEHVPSPDPECNAGCTNDAQCLDEDPCTKDFCGDAGICQHIGDPECGICGGPADCADGDECTVDFCIGGECSNIPIPDCGSECGPGDACDDSNPCTVDSCGPDGLCNHALIAGCCASNAECPSPDPCVNGICMFGTCQYVADPDCAPVCTGNADCEDGNTCTADFCVDGECQFLDIPGCIECELNNDCGDDDVCTEDICDGNTCLHLPIPGCSTDECVVAEDCKEGGDCTSKACSDGQCIYVVVPGCAGCTTGAVYTEAFDTGVSTWALSPSFQGVGWSIGKFEMSTSPPGSLYYGNPEDGTYDTSGPNSGTATSPLMVLGEGADSITLSFNGLADVEQIQTYDKLELFVLTGAGDEVEVWNKSDAEVDGEFHDYSVDLTPFAGQAVQLQFRFDTIDGVLNNTTGVVIDDVLVGQVCEVGPDCNVGDPCTDGDPCTADACVGGVCQHTGLPNCCKDDSQCDDANDCTTDACAGNACVFLPIPGCGPDCETDDQCADDNPCTTNVCQGGACLSFGVPGCCVNNGQCSDGDPCTKDGCSGNECIFEPIPGCGEECSPFDASACDDKNGCTLDQCINGKCSNTAIPNCCGGDAECDDGNPCTAQGCSADGVCQYKPIPGCCQTSAECNDGNPCTAEECSGATNTCQYKNIPGCCQTAADCPPSDNLCAKPQCVGGKCTVSTDPDCCTSDAQCADKDACTSDTCTDGTCSNLPIAGCCTADTQCNDGNACTTDSCAGGKCTSSAILGCCVQDSECSDGNGCTTDSCTNNKCTSTPSNAAGCCTTDLQCSDSNGCTANACDNFNCTTQPVPGCCNSNAGCNDLNDCTTDLCQNKVCVYEPTPGCCATAEDCDDGSDCTTETCDAATGQCTYTTLPGCCTGDAECADDNACTADSCVGGSCQNVGIPACCSSDNQCPPPACKAGACVANKCTFSEIPGCCTSDAGCDDGDSCTSDACADGVCQNTGIPGCCTSPAQCDDGQDCTIDTCDGGVCNNADDPDCCAEGTLLIQDFNSGVAAGWTVDVQGAAQWQASKLQSHSPSASWWFGNAATGNFQNPGGKSAGSTTSPAFTIPAGQSALLTFWIYVDIETTPTYDKLELHVLTGDGEGPLVWAKSAIGNTNFESWVAMKVNLSAFAGQTIQLSWVFDSVDTIQNSGQGVFLDDVKVETLCTPIEVCVFDGECDDGKVCTSDDCIGGSCVNNPIPDCCTSDAQCDDAYLCTADFCNDEGACQHELDPDCCQFDGECDDDNPCTTDACTNNSCVSTPITGDGCCATSGDCDDGNPCTKGVCDESVCQYLPDTGPGCCEPGSPLSASFDDATLQGFTVIGDGTPAKWSVQGKRFFSPAFSLYFGVPGEWNYDVDPAPSGVAISAPITIPLTAAGASLTFQTWLDTQNFGGGNFGDSFQVRVLSGTQLKSHWTMNGAPQNAWTPVTVDLSEYAGQTIQLYFDFAAANTPFGGGVNEGVYVDDISVQTDCAP